MVKAFSQVRSSLQLQNRVMPRLMQFVDSNPPGSKFYGGYTDSAGLFFAFLAIITNIDIFFENFNYIFKW